MQPILATTQLVAGYERDLPIVCGVDFSVNAGEFVVVLGPNGAGKSTLVKAIAGLVPVFGGQVILEGRDITAMPLHERITHGVSFVPQTENIFSTLTIRENLQLAADSLSKGEGSARIEQAFEMFPDLGARRKVRAGFLSGGQRQMLAVARSLITAPRVLILDEPSAGLSPKIVSEVFLRLQAINAAGITIILVEQNVKAALSIAQRGVILVEGKVRHQGSAIMLLDDPAIAELYLGSRKAQRIAS